MTTATAAVQIKCGMSCGRDVEADTAALWRESKTAEYLGTCSMGELDEWLAVRAILAAPLCASCYAAQAATAAHSAKACRDFPGKGKIPSCQDCEGVVGAKAWARFLDDAVDSWHGYLASTVKTWINTSGGRLPVGDDYKSLADYALGERIVWFTSGVIVRPRCMTCRKAHNKAIKKAAEKSRCGMGPANEYPSESKESF